VFSDNPANILLDYMRNNRYGKGLPNESIDWLSFRRAATLCNQVVNYTDSVTGKAFTCNAVIETGQTLMDNIRLILIGFRGIMPYQQGRYVLKIEHGGDDFDITATPTVPPVAFVATNDEILGGISIAGDSKRTKINRCKVTYVDPLSDFQPNEVIYPADGSADDVTFLAEDGVRLEKDVTLNMITNREQALQAAEVFVKRSRNFKQVSLATNMAGSNLTVGDLFRVINDRLGLNGVFRVVEISINEEGNIEISGFEHQSSAYGINAKGADIVRPTLSLPNPDLVEAPTGITVSSGAAFNIDNGAGYVESDATSRRLFVDWTETTDPFVRDYIVQFKESTEADFVNYTITTVPGIYITPVTLGTIYNVRVAARNELDRRSNFAEATAHTVIA
jgi:predicted phage tail protein